MVSIQGSSPIPDYSEINVQKSGENQSDSQAESVFSKYDNNPQDGIISVKEQESAFLSLVGSAVKNIDKLAEFLFNYKGFSDIKSGNTQESVKQAELSVLKNINNAMDAYMEQSESSQTVGQKSASAVDVGDVVAEIDEKNGIVTKKYKNGTIEIFDLNGNKISNKKKVSNEEIVNQLSDKDIEILNKAESTYYNVLRGSERYKNSRASSPALRKHDQLVFAKEAATVGQMHLKFSKLIDKKNAGDILNNNEQKFIDNYKNEIKQYGLGINDKNELIPLNE